MKRHIVHKQNISYDKMSVDMFFFGNSRNWKGPLNDKIKLQVDEKSNKTEKFEKSLNIYSIIIFKTIGYKLAA